MTASLRATAAIAAEGVKAFVAAFDRLDIVLGVPLSSRKCSAGAGMLARNARGGLPAPGFVIAPGGSDALPAMRKDPKPGPSMRVSSTRGLVLGGNGNQW